MLNGSTNTIANLLSPRRPRRDDCCALILLYHQVAFLDGDPQQLAVTPERFDAHMEVIARDATPVPLSVLVKGLRAGDLPDRAVAVTFDDGYADNLYEALPALERWNVPATVFATSGYIGGVREFWWDELDRLLLRTRNLPTSLRLDLGHREITWQRDGDSAPRSAFERFSSWQVEHRDLDARHTLYRTLCEALRPLGVNERDDVLDVLAEWAGAPPHVRGNRRPLDADELRRLADSELIEIGAHTVSHPKLAARPRPEQRREICSSVWHLERLIGGPVRSFSYPFGSPTSFDRRTVAVVRSAGLGCACANIEGPVTHRSDPFALPRCIVRDWDATTFARRLNIWLEQPVPAAAAPVAAR